MGSVGSFILSVLTGVIGQNIVFYRAFGVSTMISAAKNRRSLPGICLGVIYFSVISSAAAWAVAKQSSFTVEKPYFPLIYAGIIGVLYAVTLVLSRIVLAKRFQRMKKYVHISAFNSVVMGTIFLSAASCTQLWEFLLFGISSGVGFAAASELLSAVYPSLCSENVPRVFRGYPAVMIFAGIIAMAVYGIMGHIARV